MIPYLKGVLSLLTGAAQIGPILNPNRDPHDLPPASPEMFSPSQDELFSFNGNWEQPLTPETPETVSLPETSHQDTESVSVPEISRQDTEAGTFQPRLNFSCNTKNNVSTRHRGANYETLENTQVKATEKKGICKENLMEVLGVSIYKVTNKKYWGTGELPKELTFRARDGDPPAFFEFAEKSIQKKKKEASKKKTPKKKRLKKTHRSSSGVGSEDDLVHLLGKPHQHERSRRTP